MKNSIIFFLLIIVIQVPLSAQPCLQGGITITTQSQIDNFPIDYPNCTEIDGNVIISGPDIVRLSGLKSLHAINGDLEIRENEGLKSFRGLHNVITIDGNILIYDNDNIALNSFYGLEDLETINGDLIINHNQWIESLTGLENISAVEGDLIIGKDHYIWGGGNPHLNSLSGLDNLDTVRGDLHFFDNNELSNLSGLESLNFIGGSLLIDYNDVLIDFSALESLDSISNDLIILGNDSLISLSGLENIVAIEGDVRIGNYYWISQGGNKNLSSLTGLDNLISIGGNFELYENDTLSSLEALGNLAYIGGNFEIGGNNTLGSLAGLENLAVVKGNLVIGKYYSYYGNFCVGNPSLMNLSGLDNLDSIGGNLEILCSDSLATLTGLENLDYLGGGLKIGDCFATSYGLFEFGNPSLTSLNALEGITSFGGDVDIRCNDSLGSLWGLDNITTIGGCLSVGANKNLTSLEGLENLTSIDSNLTIGSMYFSIPDGLYCGDNESLTSLSALNNLTSIGGHLIIECNDELTELTGLENIYPMSIEGLSIIDNPLLSMCAITSVCVFLDWYSYPVDIRDNATGCNSRNEILGVCGVVDVDQVSASNNIIFYPNPFSTSATLEFEATDPEKLEIKIFNHMGEMVEYVEMNCQKGKNVFTWEAKDKPSGIYLIQLIAGQEIERRKVLKK